MVIPLSGSAEGFGSVLNVFPDSPEIHTFISELGQQPSACRVVLISFPAGHGAGVLPALLYRLGCRKVPIRCLDGPSTRSTRLNLSPRLPCLIITLVGMLLRSWASKAMKIEGDRRGGSKYRYLGTSRECPHKVGDTNSHKDSDRLQKLLSIGTSGHNLGSWLVRCRGLGALMYDVIDLGL